MATLIVTSGPGVDNIYPLGRRTTVVGRDEGVLVQVLDPHCSRKHFQILYKPETELYYVLDMRSRHGTLVNDLKSRGMLDETLVIWGGEFGRTPMAQGNGRDHHIKGFSVFVAGGGFKGGISHGATDDLGYNAVEDIVPVHDLHATMLHLMGVDHRRLTYKFQGRDFRLTDVFGNVVEKILA